MSWTVTGMGMSDALAPILAKKFDEIKLEEPENSVKNAAADAVALTLKIHQPPAAMKVSAYGAMEKTESGCVYSFGLQIEPILGFVHS